MQAITANKTLSDFFILRLLSGYLVDFFAENAFTAVIIKYTPAKIAGIASCKSSCIYAVAAEYAEELVPAISLTFAIKPNALAATKKNIQRR